MVSLGQTERVRAGMAEKFFQGSLYLLLVMGFCALAGTARLDAASLVLGATALVVRGYHLLRGKSVVIPDRWTGLLTLLYFAFYAVDYFLLSQSFVGATVHMVLFIIVIKIFSVQRDRDLLYLAVLAFLMVLAAAVLTVDTIFLFTFCLFMLTAIATFVSMEMRRSEREARIITVSPANENRFHRALYAVAGVLAISTVAVGIIIFFALPRIAMGGYLQSLGNQADLVTGFSDSVNLGGIGKIQQSDAAVMHVQVLHGRLPDDPKWRGVSLADFDGHRWSNPANELTMVLPMRNVPVDLWRLRFSNVPVYSILHRETLGYRIIMEPIGSYVFFLAPAPLAVNGPYYAISVSAGGEVSKTDGGRSIDIYEGEADATDPTPLVRNSISQDYPFSIKSSYLGLPPRLDARIPALARTISASATSNYDRARVIEDYLRKNFGYTLELPGEEADPLAHFLFERKRGHCEYFASSMAMMLRTLRIPARVVNGFRGGEYNDLNHTYIVRARDAHSWVEVFFPEYGWMTFDPTPSRQGPLANRNSSRLALYLDALHEMWREWIVNYDFNRQVQLGSQISAGASHLQGSMQAWYKRKYWHMLEGLRKMLGAASSGNVWIICGLGAVVMVLPLMPRLRRALKRAKLLKNPQAAPNSSASLWYTRMLKMMERKGIRKLPTQTAVEFASAIDDPEVQSGVMIFTQHYERARFAGSAEDAMLLPELYQWLAGAGGSAQ